MDNGIIGGGVVALAGGGALAYGVPKAANGLRIATQVTEVAAHASSVPAMHHLAETATNLPVAFSKPLTALNPLKTLGVLREMVGWGQQVGHDSSELGAAYLKDEQAIAGSLQKLSHAKFSTGLGIGAAVLGALAVGSGLTYLVASATDNR